MAGGKETPRQKMIGMMYLVLTALLALNVSKEIINAFVKLDQKLMEGNALIINQSDGIMLQFENAMILKANKPSVKPYYDRALEVRKMTYETDKFILMDCKNEMIKAVEGTDWVEADEKNQRFKTRNPMEIQTKDDYDVATRLFGGEEGTEGYEKGAAIRERVHKYRDELLALVTKYEYAGKKYQFDPSKVDQSDSAAMMKSLNEELKRSVYKEDHDKVRAIYKILTLPEKLQDNEEVVAWQLGTFDHAPVVAASAMFTALSNDIRNAEFKALEILYGKINPILIRVNKIDVLAFSRTNYINQGDSMDLSVMLAAYDTTDVPLIKYGIDESAENESSWKEVKGKIKLDGNKTGVHKVKGVMGVKEKGVLKWKPWEYTYEVGQPMGVISNSELNVLYTDWDNKIEAAASGYAPDKISLSGDIPATRSGDFYIVKPQKSMSGRVVTLNITGKNADGSTKQLGTKKFKVRRLPTPMIIIGTANSNSSTVDKTDLMRAQKVLSAYDPNSAILDANFKVTSYKFKINRDGVPYEKTISGNDLTQNIKDMIRILPSKSVVSFMEISVTGPNDSKFVTNCSFTIR